MSALQSVCIIDDDKIYTYGISRIIKNYLPENEVMVFENGREALRAIRELKENNEKLPDLILLDIDMPEMNGWDFLNEFEDLRREINKKIRIYVISSRINRSEQEIHRIVWNEKVDDFIQKPVKIEVLKSLLN